MSRFGQNIFDLLSEDGDDSDSKARTVAAKPADNKGAAKPPRAPGAAPAKPAADKPKATAAPRGTASENTQRPPRDQPPREPRPPREGRPPREPREPREQRPPREPRPPRAEGAPKEGGDAAAPAQSPAEALLEEKPGVRRERPPRQAGERDKVNTRVYKDKVRTNEAGGDKRLFERKSGTGRTEKENKRSGAGKANWGKEGEEGKDLAAAEKAPKEAAEDKNAERKDAVDDAAAIADADQQSQTPKKENIGLEEYQEKVKKEREGLDQVLADFKKKESKERNPSDEQSWDGFQVLKRDDGDKPQAPKKDKAGKKAADQKKTAPGVVLNVKFAAAEEKPRGKGKGKAVEGAPAKQQQQRAPDTPDVSNKDAFPALRATPAPIATSS